MGVQLWVEVPKLASATRLVPAFRLAAVALTALDDPFNTAGLRLAICAGVSVSTWTGVSPENWVTLKALICVVLSKVI